MHTKSSISVSSDLTTVYHKSPLLFPKYSTSISHNPLSFRTADTANQVTDPLLVFFIHPTRAGYYGDLLSWRPATPSWATTRRSAQSGYGLW